MKRISVSFLTLSLLGLFLFQPTQAPQPTPLVILHVTVIDATGAEAAPDQAVVIKGDRINALGKTGEIVVPPDANVIDATGKFLIPGLWDMHVHTWQDGRPELFFALLIANGATGGRDMGSPPGQLEAIKRLRQQIEEGDVLGPRIVVSGALVDGPNPMFPELSIGFPTK